MYEPGPLSINDWSDGSLITSPRGQKLEGTADQFSSDLSATQCSKNQSWTPYIIKNPISFLALLSQIYKTQSQHHIFFYSQRQTCVSAPILFLLMTAYGAPVGGGGQEMTHRSCDWSNHPASSTPPPLPPPPQTSCYLHFASLPQLKSAKRLIGRREKFTSLLAIHCTSINYSSSSVCEEFPLMEPINEHSRHLLNGESNRRRSPIRLREA